MCCTGYYLGLWLCSSKLRTKSVKRTPRALHHRCNCTRSSRRSPRSYLLISDCVSFRRAAKSVWLRPFSSRLCRSNRQNALYSRVKSDFSIAAVETGCRQRYSRLRNSPNQTSHCVKWPHYGCLVNRRHSTTCGRSLDWPFYCTWAGRPRRGSRNPPISFHAFLATICDQRRPNFSIRTE